MNLVADILIGLGVWFALAALATLAICRSGRRKRPTQYQPSFSMGQLSKEQLEKFVLPVVAKVPRQFSVANE